MGIGIRLQNAADVYGPLDIVQGAVHIDVSRAASISRIAVSLEGKKLYSVWDP